MQIRFTAQFIAKANKSVEDSPFLAKRPQKTRRSSAATQPPTLQHLALLLIDRVHPGSNDFVHNVMSRLAHRRTKTLELVDLVNYTGEMIGEADMVERLTINCMHTVVELKSTLWSYPRLRVLDFFGRSTGGFDGRFIRGIIKLVHLLVFL